MARFTVKYSRDDGHYPEEHELSFGNHVSPRTVYQTAAARIPHNKVLNEIKFEGTVIYKRGAWRRGPTYKRAFPGK